MIESAALLLPALPPTTYVWIALICFVAAAVSGMSASGGGMIVTVFIAPILGPKAIVPVITVFALFLNATRVWAYARDVNPKIAGTVLLTALPSMVAGALIYIELDETTVSLWLGITLLLAIPARYVLLRFKKRVGAAGLMTAGLPFGFVTGASIGAGMLIVPFLLAAGLAGPALLASDAVISLIMGLVRIPLFGLGEVLDLRLFLIGILMGLASIPGTWTAAWIVRRTSLRIHTVFMEVLIIAGGLNFIRMAFF